VGRVGTRAGVAPPTTLGRCAAYHAARFARGGLASLDRADRAKIINQ
jgi:hypothetical protein